MIIQCIFCKINCIYVIGVLFLKPIISTKHMFVSTYTFQYVFDQCCPIKKKNINVSANRKPWLTNGLKNACKKMNLLYKQLLKYRSEEACIKYKLYKNKLTTILRRAEKTYYCDKLHKFKNNTKQTWKILNDITRRKIKSLKC